MIRKGLIDITILGALQVSRTGDLANWLVPGKSARNGRGDGACPRREKVVVVMSHTDQKGRPKLVESCSLPLTATGCADLIITEKAVISIDDGAFVLEELLNGTTIDDVIQTTDAEIRLGECFLKRGLSMDQLEKKVTEWAEENTAKAVSLLKRLIGEKARSAMNLTHRQSF